MNQFTQNDIESHHGGHIVIGLLDDEHGVGDKRLQVVDGFGAQLHSMLVL